MYTVNFYTAQAEIQATHDGYEQFEGKCLKPSVSGTVSDGPCPKSRN